jgi:hypothetical protein
MSDVSSLPVSRWLRKYLEAEYGKTYFLKHTDPLGTLIFANLKSKTQVEAKPDPNHDQEFAIEVPQRYFERYGLQNLDPKVAGSIARTFEKIFNRKLEIWVESRKCIQQKPEYKELLIDKAIYNKLSIRNAIQDFLDHYKINEDELSLDTLRRRYNDLSQQKKKRKGTERETTEVEK